MAASKQRIAYVLVLWLVMIACPVFAQNTPGVSNSKLHLQGSLSLDSLTNYVHTHTGIRFSFNSGKIKGNTVIAFAKGEYTINRILQRLQQATGLYHLSYKSYIIFREKPFPGQASIAATPHKPLHTIVHTPTTSHTQPSLVKTIFTNPATGPHNSPLSKDTKDTLVTLPVVQLPANTIPADSIAPIEHTIAAMDTTDEKRVTRNIMNNTIRIPFATRPKDALAVIRNLQKRPMAAKASSPTERATNGKGFHPYLQAGVFTTEVLYANAGIEIGIRPAHLLLSWGTDFHINGPRIGIGSIIKNNETSQWQVNASICFLQTSYLEDSLNTGKAVFTVKGNLYSTGITWCKQLTENWVWKAGLSLNLLSTVYYKDGVKTSINGWLYTTDPDKVLHLLNRPPLLVANSFDRLNPSNIKVWPGISVGFYYNL